MKDLRRLAAEAELLNHPNGYLVLRFQDSDGGGFDLQPKIDEERLYLTGPGASGYRLAIEGQSPETLDRVGKAILTLSRQQKKARGDADVPDAGDDE